MKVAVQPFGVIWRISGSGCGCVTARRRTSLMQSKGQALFSVLLQIQSYLVKFTSARTSQP